MKILFAASEIFPFAKTGGLADVAQALPNALKSHLDVASVMPLYNSINKTSLQKSEITFELNTDDEKYTVSIFTSDYLGVKTYFIELPHFSQSGDLYGSSGSYENANPNFGLFSMAVVELAKELKVDLLHLNDWHTALCALYIQELGLDIKTVFTIHNLAYQGLFEESILKKLHIDSSYFNMDGVEFFDKVSFIKAGIAYSDAITTVSPQYAKEILTDEFGCGLHTFLQLHKDKLVGILNGIDYELFNPKIDGAIAQKFDSKSIELKIKNKKALLKEFDIQGIEKPLFVMISRVVHQKGFDLLLESIDEVLDKDLNLLILIDDENEYTKKLHDVKSRYNNLKLFDGYDEDLSHRVYAGGDFLLMPSLFEPCGLNQLISMRYGTIPLVHSVGGLLDTVSENNSTCGSGIVFSKPIKEELLSGVDRSLELSKDSKKMKQIQSKNMECDFSFAESANLYIKLYEGLVS